MLVWPYFQQPQLKAFGLNTAWLLHEFSHAYVVSHPTVTVTEDFS